MTILTDVDVLRDVAAGRVPPQVARRDKLVALRAQAMDLVREQGLLQTRASWRIVPLEGEPGEAGSLCMDGQRLQAPWLVPSSGRLTAVACAVATIGDALEQHVGELFAQRRAALGVALDSLGNELLFALSRRVQDRLWAEARQQGLTVAGELRAGDPALHSKTIEPDQARWMCQTRDDTLRPSRWPEKQVEVKRQTFILKI